MCNRNIMKNEISKPALPTADILNIFQRYSGKSECIFMSDSETVSPSCFPSGKMFSDHDNKKQRMILKVQLCPTEFNGDKTFSDVKRYKYVG